MTEVVDVLVGAGVLALDFRRALERGLVHHGVQLAAGDVPRALQLLPRRRVDAAGLRRQVVLVEAHVVDPPGDRDVHDETDEEMDAGPAGGQERFREDLDQGETVVHAGERGHGMDPVRFAALEELGQLVFRCGLPLFRGTFGQDGQERADGGRAEGVGDEADLLPFPLVVQFAPVFDERLVVGPAVAVMVIPRRMDDAVVRGAAGELRPEVARAVPDTVVRPETRRAAFDAHHPVHLRDVHTDKAVIAHEFVPEVVFAPTDRAVDEDDGKVVFLFHVHARHRGGGAHQTRSQCFFIHSFISGCRGV